MRRLMVLLRIFAWRVWTYLVRRPWTLIAGFGLLLIELLLPRSSSYSLLIAVTVVITGKGVLDVLTPVYEDMKRSMALKPRPRLDGPLRYDYAGPYRQWQHIAADDEDAVHDPELDARLVAGTPIPLEVDQRLWLPRDEYERVRALKVSTLDFDEMKLRVVDDLLAGTEKLRVCRTPYSAFLVTNRLASYEYRESNNPHEALPFEDIGLNSERLIPRLPLSNCSNHLGVDVLGISEGRILLQRQSGRNRLNGDKILGSGSGSADWQDLAASGNELGAFVRYSMRREMVEELGLSREETPDLDDIRIVGYNRTTSLGGKPQFCGVARLGPVTARIRRQEVLYVDEHLTYETFDPADGEPALRAALDRIETRYRRQLAFPLYVTIQLLRQWLDTDPDAAAWLGLATRHDADGATGSMTRR
jgi:hypothetical protein